MDNLIGIVGRTPLNTFVSKPNVARLCLVKVKKKKMNPKMRKMNGLERDGHIKSHFVPKNNSNATRDKRGHKANRKTQSNHQMLCAECAH